jgi:hypothetical protein
MNVLVVEDSTPATTTILTKKKEAMNYMWKEKNTS